VLPLPGQPVIGSPRPNSNPRRLPAGRSFAFRRNTCGCSC